MDTFNVVLTGDSFWHLRYFVASLVDRSDARVRLVANGCAPTSVAEMHGFVGRHQDRLDFVDVSDVMVAHGVALDAALRSCDDGARFCFVDPDIDATGPFLDVFLDALRTADAVTSGQELWTDENVLERGAIGVGGRHFVDSDGFVFGSPHFGMYDRSALEDTMRRWEIGFGAAGPELTPAARTRLEEAGHRYVVYDTGKILNILFQLDGHRLAHVEHPALIHIGGLSHFLAPAEGWPSGEVREPFWAADANVRARYEIARYTAAVLRSSVERRPTPPIPEAEGELRPKFEIVRVAIPELVERYREW